MSAAPFDLTFWQAHPGLAWSNANASDSQRIRAALLHPTFQRLLAIAVRFGCERLQHEWSTLQTDASSDVQQATPAVERILKNIHRGHVIATARN